MLLRLCIIVFFARIADVSLSILKTMFIVKGKRLIPSFLAFGEALIWFLIVREALTHAHGGIYIALAYALGFAVGSFVGGLLAELFIPGKITLQVFVTPDKKHIVKEIRAKGYAVTVFEYDGMEEKSYMLYINIDKKKYKDLKKIIQELDDKAFFIVNEVKSVVNGYFN